MRWAMPRAQIPPPCWEAESCARQNRKAQTIPERQALKLPDGGATALRVDDEIRRRRALMASAYTGALGMGSASTTTILGG
jgi:hypothetical protein